MKPLTGMKAMLRRTDVIYFLWYFIGLRLSVALGQYYTANPIDIRWRWRYWQHVAASKGRR